MHIVIPYGPHVPMVILFAPKMFIIVNYEILYRATQLRMTTKLQGLPVVRLCFESSLLMGADTVETVQIDVLSCSDLHHTHR